MRTIKLNSTITMPIPELRGSLNAIKFPAFGEIKYDGEFTFVCYSDGKICTINKYNRIRTDFPALNEVRDNINCKSAVMLAELYWGEGKRNALYDLNSNKDSDDLKLKIFDIFEHDSDDLTQKVLIDRKEVLQDILPVNCIATKLLSDKQDAKD